MTINYGNLTGFLTNMSFFDEKGTATHTHEFQNFRPSAINKVIVQRPDNSVIIRGLVDVGTNHKVVWKDVPALIDIKGGKTISISLNDKATNSHFASQPILGVVKSYTHCSDIPGPDMIILPSWLSPATGLYSLSVAALVVLAVAESMVKRSFYNIGAPHFVCQIPTVMGMIIKNLYSKQAKH